MLRPPVQHAEPVPDADQPPVGWGFRVVVAVTAAVVAVAISPPTLADDAAISFRYATRLATGAGLTYDDHERVLGVSNALYTLVLAGFDRLGVSPPTAARLLGVLAVAGAAVLTAELSGRLAGRRAAVVGAALLLVAAPFVGLATSGLESGLAVVLGLGAFLAVVTDRRGLAGVLVGLALVNKLDAGLLLVSLAGTAAALERRPPWRLVGVAVLTALPWFVLSTAVYGSPLPRSLTSKLAGNATPDGYDLDPTWAARLLGPAIALLAVAAVLSWIATPDRRRRAVTGGLLAWAGLQLLAASTLPLGGEYGWYLTVVIPPLAVAGGIAATEVDRPPAGVRQAVVAIALVLAAGWGVTSTARDAFDRGPDAGDLLERDRIAAGRWLAEHAAPGDVVDTCFGWVAYEAFDLPVADRCGLTTDRSPGTPAFTVETPAGDGEDCPAGTSVAVVFDSAARSDPDQPRLAVCRAMLSDHD